MWPCCLCFAPWPKPRARSCFQCITGSVGSYLRDVKVKCQGAPSVLRRSVESHVNCLSRVLRQPLQSEHVQSVELARLWPLKTWVDFYLIVDINNKLVAVRKGQRHVYGHVFHLFKVRLKNHHWNIYIFLILKYCYMFRNPVPVWL